jgi:diguanylate cyclase (GGDEF)-like protein
MATKPVSSTFSPTGANNRIQGHSWRWMTMLMLFSGALSVELAISTPMVSASDPLAGHLCAIGLFAVGLYVAFFHPNFLTATRLSVTAGIAAITVLIAIGEGVTMVPVFYLWPLLGAAYLLSRIGVALCGAVAAAGYLGALVIQASGDLTQVPIVDFAIWLVASTVVLLAVRQLSEGMNVLVVELRRASSTDPLTGLLNRRSFERRYARAYDAAVSADAPLCAVFFDLDHFKSINDRFGHAAGDAALKRFAALLTASTRSDDLVARTGGEEFAVVMPGTTLTDAHAIAERFSTILRQDQSIQGVHLTVSTGIAPRTADTTHGEALLAAADDAVYEAKRAGRDRVVVASDHARRWAGPEVAPQLDTGTGGSHMRVL